MAGKGAQPGHGKMGGRKPGTLNHATLEIKELVRQHCPAAAKELARLATDAMSEQARVAAIKELFDRGYGKAPQPHDGDGQGGPMKWIVGWEK
jgi:hypothetical protein